VTRGPVPDVQRRGQTLMTTGCMPLQAVADREPTCHCPHALAEQPRGADHLRVSCRAAGRGSVWYKPRHEAGR